MRKEYESTLEEAVQANVRLAELAGILEKQKRAALALSPVAFLVLFLIPYGAFEFGAVESLVLAVLTTLLYIFLYVVSYKKKYRKEARKTVVRMLGTDKPVPCEYEIDETGLVFRKMGQEIRFSWGGVKEVNANGDVIEVITEPFGIAIIPKRIFLDPAELQEWVTFIKSHAGSERRPGTI